MIGALSLVMVVWLGTSMNCSRMSTLTGRSMIGIRKSQARTRGPWISFGLAEPEHDHPLVLLDDPDRQVEDDQQDDDDERADRRAGLASCPRLPPIRAVRDAARGHVPVDDDASGSTMSVSPSTSTTRTGVPRSSGRPSAVRARPFLAAGIDRAERARAARGPRRRVPTRRVRPDRAGARPIRRDRMAPNDDRGRGTRRPSRSTAMIDRRRDADDRLERVDRPREQRGRAQREAHDAADAEQAVAGDGQLEPEQDEPEDDQQQPADVQRQRARGR